MGHENPSRAHADESWGPHALISILRYQVPGCYRCRYMSDLSDLPLGLVCGALGLAVVFLDWKKILNMGTWFAARCTVLYVLS